MEGVARIPAARERPFGHLRRPDSISARRRRTAVSHRVHRQEGGRAARGRRSRSSARPIPGGPTRPRRSARRWNGIKKSIGNNGFANSPGDPPAFCFYRPHHAGQGTYQLAFRMPWPIVGPVHARWARRSGTTATSAARIGSRRPGSKPRAIDYDVLSDTDLHLDSARPRRLQGALRRRAQRILVVRGDGARSAAFSIAGGNAVVLSGNTAFWRVSFNADASIIECRKGDAPGTQVRADRRGEMWHSHDGRRGGMSRECGFPAWRLFGLEYFSLVGVGAPGVGPYKVRDPRPLSFSRARRPEACAKATRLATHRGACFRSRSATRATSASRRSRSSSSSRLPRGWRSPPKIRAGITLLAEGFADWKKVSIVALGLLPAAGSGRPKHRPIPVAAEMIYWERPGGGRVFHGGSINAGSTLAEDPKWSGLLKNVLAHFGVPLP